MFKALSRMIWGEKVWATIIECRDEIENEEGSCRLLHTLVMVEHERKWVRGHLGKSGESIMVNTKELNSY